MKDVSIGAWVERAVDSLIQHFGQDLGVFSDAVGSAIESFTTLVLTVPAGFAIAGLTAMSLIVRKNIKLALLTAGGLALTSYMGYWQATMETLTLVLIATFVSTLVGLPIGILAAHQPRFYTWLKAILDMMQTIPTFVYLIPTLMLFGLGVVPGLISTIIFAVASPIRATYLGVSSVPKSLKDVSIAFGASRWQCLLKIELPHAKQTILAGINQCLMLSLSMVVIAALVGADGLGKPVLQALNTVNLGAGFEAGLAIVILAIILDRSLLSHGKEVSV